MSRVSDEFLLSYVVLSSLPLAFSPLDDKLTFAPYPQPVLPIGLSLPLGVRRP